MSDGHKTDMKEISRVLDDILAQIKLPALPYLMQSVCSHTLWLCRRRYLTRKNYHSSLWGLFSLFFFL